MLTWNRNWSESNKAYLNVKFPVLQVNCDYQLDSDTVAG